MPGLQYDEVVGGKRIRNRTQDRQPFIHAHHAHQYIETDLGDQDDTGRGIIEHGQDLIHNIQMHIRPIHHGHLI